MVTSRFQRCLRFWSGHLLLLNLVLFGLVCLLYGNLGLVGHGYVYAKYARDFRLGFLSVSDSAPGVENVLLPGLAAAFRTLLTALGFEYTDTIFIVFAAIPYALFIYGVTRHISRCSRGGRLLAMAAAIALYTSGMIPYMTSWGGYVDGLSYLLILPVFVWPESLLVYAAAFVLQCANHYLGALAQLLFAFVWYSVRALDQTETRASALRHWLATFVPRAILSVAILAAFIWFWETYYPDVARIRQEIAMEKWQNPEGVLQEVLTRFPWTLLSTLKLAVVPVAALMLAVLPRKGLRMLVLGTPFLAAAALTFVFLDITRMATMLVMPAFLMTMLAAGTNSALPTRVRRPLRRLLIVTALLNLLIPNYYVNNGNIVVPESRAIGFMISNLIGLID